MEKLILATHKGLYVTILCFLLTSFSCNPTPSVTPTLTPNTTSTLSPNPTDTPAPTATVQPSATPSPTATSTPLIAGLGQVIFGESFNDIGFLFNIPGPNKIESGVLILDETPEDQFANGIYGIESIPPGATTIVLFKTTAPGAKFFNIGYHNDQYGTEQLRRFSYNSNVDTWDLYEGNASTNGGNSPVKSWNASQVRSDT